jgi:hypothetical protein
MAPTSSEDSSQEGGEVLMLPEMVFQIPAMSLSAEQGSLLMPPLWGFYALRQLLAIAL